MYRILLLLFLLLGGSLQAQDEGVFNHYHITPILLHPSVAGFNNTHQIQLNTRASWAGFEEAPVTFMAQYNGPIGNTFGLGLSVLSENAAQLKRNRIRGSFAFRFQVSDKVRMATGFSTEYQRHTVGNEVLNNNFFQGGDVVLDQFIEGKDVFDASLGVYTTINDATYLGLSFINLVRARLDDVIDVGNNQQSFFKYYAFTGGHRFDVVDLNFSLEPSFMIRQVLDAPFMMDVNLKAGFLDEQLVTGLSYRSLGSVGILLGTRFSGIQLYYSYDVSFQRFQQYNSGMHELTFALNFQPKAKPGDPNYTKVKYQSTR